MTSKNIKSLLDKLTDYEKQNKFLQEANFSSHHVGLFKKYYDEMYLEFIAVVKKMKNKKLSDTGKSLQVFSDIFGHTNKLILQLTLTVFISIFSLIFLYYIKTNIWLIIAVTSAVVITISILMRRIQNQPKRLINRLNHNEEIVRKIVFILQNQ